ncbi:MFS transporter [Sphingomonas bacterium]|uniref:MFS transporter n=1 Tax=Sphingomonas bacterium TaxID=1895847 RepID=UPI00157684EB|nr:MFS transporter [Sphingomonas bacterium]
MPYLTTAQRVRAVLAGSAGNLVEWYDFYVYAFTALYFSPAFFPKSDRLAQLFATSGIFAMGFLVRPIGGWYFGRYADRHGRARAMIVSVMMMGAGSLGIALLPTYRRVGALAPALLLVGRMAQGFSTGGQYGTAATYLSEVATPERRGFWGSFQYVTLIGGQLLATVTVLLLQWLLGGAAMARIGWRIAFAGGAIAAALFVFARRHLPETAPPERRHGRAGELGALVPHGGAVLAVIGLTAGGSVVFYTYTTYMQKFLVLTAGLSPTRATLVMTAALIPFAAMQPLFGALADRWGRRVNLVAFGALATGSTVPLLGALAHVTSGGAAFVLVLAGLTVNAIYTSVGGLFKAELFPVHVRALGVGLSYGIGNALFGGTAESVALGFKRAGHEAGFAWYVTALSALALVTALVMRLPDRRLALADVAA